MSAAPVMAAEATDGRVDASEAAAAALAAARWNSCLLDTSPFPSVADSEDRLRDVLTDDDLNALS